MENFAKMKNSRHFRDAEIHRIDLEALFVEIFKIPR